MKIPLIEARKVGLSYRIGGVETAILTELEFQVNPGDFIAIQGPSGSGKSTLFYILGLLMKATRGQVLWKGKDVSLLSSDEMAWIRNRKVGFIFQQFHLLSKTTVLENILLPASYPSETHAATAVDKERAIALAEKLGLKNHLNHLPNQLSGGQQQRVAIARALIHDVDLILADEPTGNLDSRNASQILDLLTDLNRQGKTVVLITHDSEVAQRCSKIFHMKDGKLVETEERPSLDRPSREETVNLSRDPLLDSNDVRNVSRNYIKMSRSLLPLVFQNLLRNKTRSFLTMLGVVIGIAAVLSMITLSEFTKRRILETYETLGVNKVVLRGYPNWNLRATDAVTTQFQAFEWESDILPLKKLVPEIQRMSPVFSGWHSSATSGGLKTDDKVTAMGVLPDYLNITNRNVLLGKGFSPFHIENRSPVCLIGFDVASRLFSRVQPIGQIVSISDGRQLSFPCKVIGVLQSVSSNVDWSPPNLHILLPYTYFRAAAGDWWLSQMHEVAIQITSGSDAELTGKKIKAFFERKYGKSGQFNVDADGTLVAQMKRFLNLFSVLLGGIAFLALAVGGIGINNMMLVSVSERIKEFGIRKALGATDRSIRTQVLLESMTLCGVAGLLGVIFGFVGYELMVYGATQFVPKLKFEWIFEPMAAGISFFSIFGVGVCSGVVPSVRAEKLQVIEALRTE